MESVNPEHAPFYCKNLCTSYDPVFLPFIPLQRGGGVPSERNRLIQVSYLVYLLDQHVHIIVLRWYLETFVLQQQKLNKLNVAAFGVRLTILTNLSIAESCLSVHIVMDIKKMEMFVSCLQSFIFAAAGCAWQRHMPLDDIVWRLQFSQKPGSSWLIGFGGSGQRWRLSITGCLVLGWLIGFRGSGRIQRLQITVSWLVHTWLADRTRRPRPVRPPMTGSLRRQIRSGKGRTCQNCQNCQTLVPLKTPIV